MKQSTDQILFKRNMHWAGTVSGAFQHSGLYESRSVDSRKKEFRVELRKRLESIESKYNISAVTTKGHVTQIKKLQAWSEKFKEILKDGKLSFGLSQKLLNLHLKGLWCFGLLKYPPPNFPVDRIIQDRLKIRPIIPWTQMIEEEPYLKIIEAAKKIADKYKISLPELELRVYNGTLKIIK
jgi:hypothetical protein